MLTEERTAKFNNSIRVNWKTERERERERVRTPGLHITPPGKLREQRGICSTRLQGAFTLMSACHHIQDRGSRYMLRASVRAMTHTCTHTHPIAYIRRLSTLPSLHLTLLHENPQLKPTFKSRQYQYFEAHFILSVSIDLHKLNVSATSSSFSINWFNKTINSTGRQTFNPFFDLKSWFHQFWAELL